MSRSNQHLCQESVLSTDNSLCKVQTKRVNLRTKYELWIHGKKHAEYRGFHGTQQIVILTRHTETQVRVIKKDVTRMCDMQADSLI